PTRLRGVSAACHTAVCHESTQKGAVVSSEGVRCHYGHATRARHGRCLAAVSVPENHEECKGLK
ncbi:MAG: hypothetical protein ACPIOQ_51860, partial [Promethearchaeia archaeon]